VLVAVGQPAHQGNDWEHDEREKGWEFRFHGFQKLPPVK